MIVGVGTDIVELERIRSLMAGPHAEAFRRRAFTAKELSEAARRREATSYYAGRWAAKEAASKALGCGIGEFCSLTDIEVLSDPLTGAPRLTFIGAGAATSSRLGVTAVHLSISHEAHYAVATVLLEK